MSIRCHSLGFGVLTAVLVRWLMGMQSVRLLLSSPLLPLVLLQVVMENAVHTHT